MLRIVKWRGTHPVSIDSTTGKQAFDSLALIVAGVGQKGLLQVRFLSQAIPSKRVGRRIAHLLEEAATRFLMTFGPHHPNSTQMDILSYLTTAALTVWIHSQKVRTTSERQSKPKSLIDWFVTYILKT